MGELFHPRTIAYYNKNNKENFYSVKGLADNINIENDPGIFIKQGNSLQMSYELSDDIAKNAFVVRASLDENNEQKKIEYLRGQRDLTNLLKLMMLLNKKILQPASTASTSTQPLTKKRRRE